MSSMEESDDKWPEAVSQTTTYFSSLEEAEAAFAWYVNHVGEQEGITFLGRCVADEDRDLADSIIEFDWLKNSGNPSQFL